MDYKLYTNGRIEPGTNALIDYLHPTSATALLVCTNGTLYHALDIGQRILTSDIVERHNV